MIPITFNPDDVFTGADATWWEQWKQDAKDAREEAVESWESQLDAYLEAKKAGKELPELKVTFKADLWREFRNKIRRQVFRNRCAYCETGLTGSYPDAEHYRPKGAIKTMSCGGTRKIEVLTHRKHRMPHPGYFWLAYSWRNLLPACKVCNSGNKGSLFAAKRFGFLESAKTLGDLSEDAVESPNKKGFYYPGVLELDRLEQPLLLHPGREGVEPSKHLRFGVGGSVVPAPLEGRPSPVGKCSIRAYGLDSGDLKQERAIWDPMTVRRFSDSLSEQAELGREFDEMARSARDHAIGKIRGDGHPYIAYRVSYVRLVISRQFGPQNGANN